VAIGHPIARRSAGSRTAPARVHFEVSVVLMVALRFQCFDAGAE
jgi:hypothetical protein